MRDDIVWNSDPRNRPDLDVDYEIMLAPDDVPGEHYAHARPDLEVELDVVFVDAVLDAWCLDDETIARLPDEQLDFVA